MLSFYCACLNFLYGRTGDILNFLLNVKRSLNKLIDRSAAGTDMPDGMELGDPEVGDGEALANVRCTPNVSWAF